MKLLEFKIDGIPIPQARPRVTKSGHCFTPERSRNFRERVRQAATKVMEQSKIQCIDEAIHLSIITYFPVPKSWSEKKKRQALEGKFEPASRSVGDCDNLAKGIMDGMNGIVFTDDARVVSLFVAKHYAEEPRAEVYVEVGND